MYRRIDRGEVVNIQGLPCCIPPIGWVWDIIENKLVYTGVYSRSENIKEQYWERLPYPSWYKEVTKREDEYLKKKKEGDDPFYDEKYEEYKKQEWFRRLNGIWIMVKGKPVFIPPLYYYMLQWFRIDVGYIKFTKPHLNAFMFLEYCIDDPICWGMLGVTKRRFLKTYMIGAFITEYITRTKNTNGVLQSKTGEDAKKVFAKAIVFPFRGMPRFFRPEYDTSLGINPKTEMRFQQTNVRGKKAEDSIDKDELNSMIGWGSADPIYFDGWKLQRYGSDEWGKTTEANVYDRNEVVRFCQMDEEGRIIGKSLWFTTVEKLDSDKDGVQEAAKQLWNASDQNNRKENGQTESGLYRFFQTADESKNFDIYGDPDVEQTIKDILEDRESVKNNLRSLSARIRKEPRTIEEAFSEDGDKCVFNVVNIMERERWLAENPIPKREVLFYMDEETQMVKWRDIQKSESDFCWKFSPDAELGSIDSNKSVIDGAIRKPGRVKLGAISVDSYSNSQGGRKYGSKASAWVGRKYDIINPHKTGKPVGHLYGRPKEKDELHKQVMLCGIFMGYEVFYEHTADDYYTYFRDRGKIGYLGRYPMSLIDTTKRGKDGLERHKGTPITPFSLTKQLDNGIAFFENHCDKLDFEEIFLPAKKFDPYNRTVSDTIVALLILITVLYEPVYLPPPQKTPLVKVYPNPMLQPGYN